MVDSINLKVISPPPKASVTALSMMGETNMPKLIDAVTMAIAVARIPDGTAFATINEPAGIVADIPKPIHVAAIKRAGSVPTVKIKNIPKLAINDATEIVRFLNLRNSRPNKMPVTIPPADMAVLIRPLVDASP